MWRHACMVLLGGLAVGVTTPVRGNEAEDERAIRCRRVDFPSIPQKTCAV
jgi:hypothetical protein